MAYKNPIPQCNQVLTITQCSAYSPWYRNYTDALHKTSVDINPLGYTAGWFRGMFEHSFFTSSSGSDAEAFYVHARPLPVISLTAIVVFVGGAGLFLRYRKDILREYPALKFLLFVSIAYCATLWMWNYHDFIHLGDAVALNRALFVPGDAAGHVGAGAGSTGNGCRQRPNLKVVLLGAIFVLFLAGRREEAITFIDASNAHWYWPKPHHRQRQRT